MFASIFIYIYLLLDHGVYYFVSEDGESVIVLFSSFSSFFSLVIITLYNPLTYSFVCFFTFHLNISRGTRLYLYVSGTSPFSPLCS